MKKSGLTPRDKFLRFVPGKSPTRCKAAFCRNPPDVGHGYYCSTCRKRWWRHQNLRLDRFTNLKNNAKRRKIEFHLTFEQFVEICEATGYTADGHVQFGDRLSLDRIKREDGYALHNLRVISVRENSRRSVNPRILVCGEWLDHEFVSFDDDPLQKIREQAVLDKIQKSSKNGDEFEDDDIPAWLRDKDPF